MTDTRGSFQPVTPIGGPTLYIRRGPYGVWLMAKHGDGHIEVVGWYPLTELADLYDVVIP